MLQKGKQDVPFAKEKLLLLLERSLSNLAYQDMAKLSPDYPQFQELDLKWFEHIERLRKDKTLEKNKAANSLSVCVIFPFFKKKSIVFI